MGTRRSGFGRRRTQPVLLRPPKQRLPTAFSPPSSSRSATPRHTQFNSRIAIHRTATLTATAGSTAATSTRSSSASGEAVLSSPSMDDFIIECESVSGWRPRWPPRRGLPLPWRGSRPPGRELSSPGRGRTTPWNGRIIPRRPRPVPARKRAKTSILGVAGRFSSLPEVAAGRGPAGERPHRLEWPFLILLGISTRSLLD